MCFSTHPQQQKIRERRKYDHAGLFLNVFLHCSVFFHIFLGLGPVSHCQLRNCLIIEQVVPSPPDVQLRDRASVLMFRLQMRETSNPEHGCVAEMHASVHCQPVGMLTDDAPQSSSPPPQSLSDSDRPPPLPPQNMGGKSRKHTARLFTAHRY